jgi:hypothetical protein
MISMTSGVDTSPSASYYHKCAILFETTTFLMILSDMIEKNLIPARRLSLSLRPRSPHARTVYLKSSIFGRSHLQSQGFPVFPEGRATASSCPTYVAERDRLPTNLEGLAPYHLLKVLHLGKA